MFFSRRGGGSVLRNLVLISSYKGCSGEHWRGFSELFAEIFEI